MTAHPIPWIDTGVAECRRAYAGAWVAMVWPNENGTWSWRVATFDRDAGQGTSSTESAAKDAAMTVLIRTTTP